MTDPGYWREVLAGLSHSHGAPDDWADWKPTHFADGITLIPRELEEFLDLRSAHLSRAVMMFVWPLDSVDGAKHPESLGAWVKIHEEDKDRPLLKPFTEELVLNLVVNATTALIAKELLAAWLDPSTSVEGMEGMILKHPGVNLED